MTSLPPASDHVEPRGRANQRVVAYLKVAAVAIVVLYGALLRFDAISRIYDPVTSPRWLRQLEISRSGDSILRPSSMRWVPSPRFQHHDGPPTQYRSDPYTYLEYAREMHSFYAAHRREPLFPFATKVWLWLLGNQDVAVSFASAAFSVAAIALTYLLGAAAYSYGVGLVAAFLFAIEYDIVSWSVEGWRDDAFTVTVLACALALVRFAQAPGRTRAILLGLAAGAACLTRITALSFVVPVLAAAAVYPRRPWRVAASQLGFAVAVAAIVSGPFFFNSWRTFGDPLHSINTHVDAYDTSADTSGEKVSDYASRQLRARPMATIDTIALGMTQYPYESKWIGFDRWIPGAGRVLAIATLAGLLLWMAHPAGRLLLLIVATSLLPFALTWRVAGYFRFTLHAYPFFLIAACTVPWFVARRERVFGNVPALSGAAIAAVAVWLVMTRVMPVAMFEEALSKEHSATILAGDRDIRFFGSDWPDVLTQGPVTTRIANVPRPSIRVPLDARTDYDALLRVDSAALTLLWNGRVIARCDPESRADRVGICRFTIPGDAVRGGMNRLTLVPDAVVSPTRVWYLRIASK